jgi:hypothetical protein
MGMEKERKNSNGHGEGKEESMNLVETTKILQTDVQIYKDDNERLMKVKEQHEDFNIKLMQSLGRTPRPNPNCKCKYNCT